MDPLLAERVETILRRTVFNIFKEALRATAEHRGTTRQISNVDQILKHISESRELRVIGNKYRKQFPYAESILHKRRKQNRRCHAVFKRTQHNLLFFPISVGVVLLLCSWYSHCNIGSIAVKKYSVITSGVSFISRESHQSTVSTKEDEM